MTFAACVTDTVGPPVTLTAAEAPSEALTFGSLAFDSVPGVADPLEGVTGARLGGDASPDAEPGGTRAADGGTTATDAVAVALLADVDAAEGD
jgi:hypothetical protein